MNRVTALLLPAIAALGPDVQAQAAEPSGRELVAQRPPDGKIAAGAFVQQILRRFYGCDLLDHRRSL